MHPTGDFLIQLLQVAFYCRHLGDILFGFLFFSYVLILHIVYFAVWVVLTAYLDVAEMTDKDVQLTAMECRGRGKFPISKLFLNNDWTS